VSRRNARRNESAVPSWWSDKPSEPERADDDPPSNQWQAEDFAPRTPTDRADTSEDSDDRPRGAATGTDLPGGQPCHDHSRAEQSSGAHSAPAPGFGQVHAPAAVRLATCFAVDYLSWDEDDPGRREQALRSYFPVGVAASRGWSGRGRQRATFAVAGPARTETDPAVVWVDIQALLTRYQRRPAAHRDSPPRVPTEGELASRVSSAPAPDAPGWRALDSEWIPLSVPVRRLPSGHLVIDITSDGATTIGADTSATTRAVESAHPQGA
jgi:hypothetical protein